MTRLFGLSIAAVLMLSLAAGASAAGPPVGIYQGVIDGSQVSPPNCGARHNEGEGYLRVSKSPSGKLRIVPVGTASSPCSLSIPKITAPSASDCHQLNAGLTASSIALKKGAFDYSGTAPIGPASASRSIHFKGHWSSKSKKFVGFTQISGGGCNSGKAPWHMKRLS